MAVEGLLRGPGPSRLRTHKLWEISDLSNSDSFSRILISCQPRLLVLERSHSRGVFSASAWKVQWTDCSTKVFPLYS